MLERISDVVANIDEDGDGIVKLEPVNKVIEFLGKEEMLEVESRIQKILGKMPILEIKSEVPIYR